MGVEGGVAVKLTKYQIEVLETAKTLLINYEQVWICDAIWFIWDGNKLCIYAQTQACKRLVGRINRLLKGYFDLQDWLHRKAGIEESLLTPKNMREYRLRWIDHMIETREI